MSGGWSASLAAAALLAGCAAQGPQGSTEIPPEARLPSTPSATPTDPAATPEAFPRHDKTTLLPAVEKAIAAQTSVHVELGNINPPPVATLEQAYGDGGTDLRFSLIVDPDQPAGTVLRSDGVVYVSTGGGPFTQIAQGDPSLATSAPVAHALLRTDVRQDFAAIAKSVLSVIPIGLGRQIGTEAFEYSLTLDYRKWIGAQPGGSSLDLPAALPEFLTATLWVDQRDLPVRLEFIYSEKGDPGTGTGRFDYSDWSTPVEVAAPEGDRLQQ